MSLWLLDTIEISFELRFFVFYCDLLRNELLGLGIVYKLALFSERNCTKGLVENSWHLWTMVFTFRWQFGDGNYFNTVIPAWFLYIVCDVTCAWNTIISICLKISSYFKHPNRNNIIISRIQIIRGESCWILFQYFADCRNWCIGQWILLIAKGYKVRVKYCCCGKLQIISIVFSNFLDITLPLLSLQHWPISKQHNSMKFQYSAVICLLFTHECRSF